MFDSTGVYCIENMRTGKQYIGCTGRSLGCITFRQCLLEEDE